MRVELDMQFKWYVAFDETSVQFTVKLKTHVAKEVYSQLTLHTNFVLIF